ncbi:hypothetical protein Dimus_000161 [Dionaea muscipula]
MSTWVISMRQSQPLIYWPAKPWLRPGPRHLLSPHQIFFHHQDSHFSPGQACPCQDFGFDPRVRLGSGKWRVRSLKGWEREERSGVMECYDFLLALLIMVLGSEPFETFVDMVTESGFGPNGFCYKSRRDSCLLRPGKCWV